VLDLCSAAVNAPLVGPRPAARAVLAVLADVAGATTAGEIFWAIDPTSVEWDNVIQGPEPLSCAAVTADLDRHDLSDLVCRDCAFAVVPGRALVRVPGAVEVGLPWRVPVTMPPLVLKVVLPTPLWVRIGHTSV
jgi:hypothetical protein